ncbi:hypothetical protein, partial [Teredinibacter waterburyi]|uniref:hypothetical protein n=1 Tax=Teredinibacter waterburyi TaxID=1500538 RepID=UPI00165F3E00
GSKLPGLKKALLFLAGKRGVSCESNMRILFVLLIIFSITACSFERGSDAEEKGTFSVGTLDENSVLLEKLRSGGVSSAFMDSEGYIGYDIRETAEVRSIKRAFLHEGINNPNNIAAEGVVNELHLAMYEEAFISEGIPYKIDRSGDLINIKWRAEYDESVDQIVEDVSIAWLKHIVSN